MNKKNLIIGAVLLILGLLIGRFAFQGQKIAGTSPSGSTFNTAKFAGVAVNLVNPGASGTSTSILNTDANDRYTTSLKVACENVGTSKSVGAGGPLASLLLTVATTSTAAPASIGPFAAIALNAIVSTSTPGLIIASSTAASGITSMATSTFASIWSSGSYMTFFFNATNTALCTVGVDYIGS